MIMKKTVRATIEINKSHLKYKIANVGYILSRSPLYKDLEDRSFLTDLMDLGNVDRVNQTLEISIDELNDIFFPWTKYKIQQGAYYDNTGEYTEDEDDFLLMLKMPDNIAYKSVKYWTDLIEEYLVDSVWIDWLLLNYPEGANIWIEKKADMEQKIKKSLTTRVKPLRLRIQP